MKIDVRAVLFYFVCFLLPAHVVHADISTTSPHQIGFYCPPYTESFVEGEYYQVSTTTTFCTWQVGTIPPGVPAAPHYGGLFRGVVGSSTGFGNFMGLAFQAQLVLSVPISNPQQGEPFFAAVWENRSGPAFEFDLQRFMNFFRTGANPPPSNGWGVINWKWGEAPDESPDPVVIIPGILGSQEHNGEWIIDPILHTYDDLVATLDINGYTPGLDLFTFPYDWRKSNIDTALLLKQKIDEVKIICRCDKVDLVAHSMGGLVARQYIQSGNYDQDVDQLIFLGTPHLGAPKAYLIWEGGEIGPFLPLSGTFMEKVLKEEAKVHGFSDLFTYIRNKPISSVQELLPVYDYIFEGNSVRQYPTNYPINNFLDNLNGNLDKLLNSGVRLYNFVGETGTQETLSGLQIVSTDEYAPMWEHGYPDGYYDFFGNHGFVLGSGDNTVSTASASFINSNLSTVSHPHDILPTGVEGDIYHILSGKIAIILSHEFDSFQKKVLHLLMRSPADLLVITPDGKKIGKENGQEINQIANAFYTGFNTDTEFITILNPLDGEYKIFAQGVDDGGTYTIETTYLNQQEIVEASFTGNITSGLVTELVVFVDNENPEILDIEPTDNEPPVISIVSPEAKDYVRSEQLPVNVSTVDVESGVYALETLLGTTTILNVGTVDLFFQKLGNHVLTASSTDNVSNLATSSRAFRVIATPDSTLSDIERAYSLGWMTKGVRDSLTKKLNAAIKIFKFLEKKTDGKPKGDKVQKVVDKILAAAMLIELRKLRGKGLNEQAYQLLGEDIQWLINN